MRIIDRSHQHRDYDASVEPAATVKAGEEVVFETLDACWGEVRTTRQLFNYKSGSQPIAGPVFIEGVRPGDTLVVDVLDITVESGFQLIGPNRAIIRNEITEWTCYEVHTRGDRLLLPNGIELPVKPNIGSFGNAPAGEPTIRGNPCGGTLDVPAARAGARLYIPVEVPGALFSLGDVHARQGDGEVVGAPEMDARVTVRFDVLQYQHSDWCMIEDDTHWHTPRSAKNEAEAARLATLQNARFIAKNYDVAFKDALVILTMIGELSVSLTGYWPGLEPVVCASFPKLLLKESLAQYRKV